ncbi:hypothetical protein C8R45DRAFT_251334 [Mycena sanguinolenta]|nr:hypothetical protein C8R45DRAFT_251334 [Mycena sanguinolenta]
MHILFFLIPIFLPRCTGAPWPSDGSSLLRTGATPAGSDSFEVAASPRIISAGPSTTAPSAGPPSMSLFTDMLATQSQSAQTSTRIARGTLIGVILGAVAWTAITAAGLAWFLCVRRRRRAAPTGPVLIDDDDFVKIKSEESLSMYVQHSPFPVALAKPALPTLSPLRVSGLRPVSEWPSPASTAASSHSAHRLKTSYKYGSVATSPASSYHPPPKYGQGWYECVPQRRDRKQSYNLPSSPLTKAAVSSQDRARSIALSVTQRLEQQDDLETAFSETVYDDGEEPDKEGTPKTPRRLPPLRLRTIGSTDGHDCEPDDQESHPSESPLATPR